VNIALNGHIAAAALGDGTIRWYRLKDGKELLAYFPHKDRKRWVLWTPSGYYTASPGADELIGWHLNNGPDRAADFFPISKFKDRFYRPDVITRVLDTLDESLALKQADEAAGRRQKAKIDIRESLPPVITIVSPGDGEVVSDRDITIAYSVRTPETAPVTRVWAVADGISLSDERGIARKKQDGTGTLTVRIPAKDCEVSLIAQNRNAASSLATIRLKWQGKAAQNAADIMKPRLYLLAIGVSRYQDPNLTLAFAAKDAVDFVNVMQQQKGRIYREVLVNLLQDAKMVYWKDWTGSSGRPPAGMWP
jgi:hypothetical protein